MLQILQMTSKKAVDMARLVKEELDKAELDPSKLISFTADNTNSNFGGMNRGGNNNVYAILKGGLC